MFPTYEALKYYVLWLVAATMSIVLGLVAFVICLFILVFIMTFITKLVNLTIETFSRKRKR